MFFCVSRFVVYVVRVSVCRCSFSLLGVVFVVVFFLCFVFRIALGHVVVGHTLQGAREPIVN